MTGWAEYLENLMKVKCITIEGENAIISAAEFDWLCDQARKVEVLLRVVSAAAPEVQAKVADGWRLVLEIGTMVKADHPITCLNPTEYFEVTEVEVTSTGARARGKNTCWFGTSMLAAAAAAPEVQS
jgi:hypothetical protein